MTISELLLLLQTIIALMALIVSVIQVVHEMSKDKPHGQKHKKK